MKDYTKKHKIMNCIIVDDEPIARRGIERLVSTVDFLQTSGSFEDALSAGSFLKRNSIELIFLDIQMPGINGLEFARQIPRHTLIIFTTAFAEFALDSYEVDAVDYLVKPITTERFHKSVHKAAIYYEMLSTTDSDQAVPQIKDDFVFVKSERRYFKVELTAILFIEALKDYVIVQTNDQRLITHMNLKAMQEILPSDRFLRANRSYIVNIDHIDSFSNNDVFIKEYEIAIGNFYRDTFLSTLMGK